MHIIINFKQVFYNRSPVNNFKSKTKQKEMCSVSCNVWGGAQREENVKVLVFYLSIYLFFHN